MSEAYEEIIEGETLLRFPPGARHERICARLHKLVAASIPPGSPARLLPPRSVVQVSYGSIFRPDLALVTAATRKAWLVVEVMDTEDHQSDTVLKKNVYEEARVPRLWMVDPRYDNIEVYHGTQHGLALQRMLANKDVLKEPLLPTLALRVGELFGP